jgi:outer membrane protein OmpU
MKKLLLLGASGLALGVASNAAFADDPVKVTISGTGQEWFGYASNNRSDVGAYSKTFSASNNDFALNGSTKLDNGITVSVSLSMNASPGGEGSNASLSTAKGNTLNTTTYTVGTGSPETNYVGFSGAFGSVNVGWQGNAATNAIQDAPYLGVAGLSWSRWSGWIHESAGGNLVTGSGTTSTFDDYWANKVVYNSPVFAGLQVSGSYTPNMASQDAGTVATSGAASGNWGGDAESLALTYGGDFGSAKVKAALAWTGESFNGQPTPGSGLVAGQGGHVNGYQGSLQVTFGGFTVGGAVNDREVGGKPPGAVASYDLETALAEGITWDIGVQYKTGPWGIAVNYYTSEADDNNGNGNTLASGKSHVDFGGAQLEYALGPGITLDWENGYAEYKTDGAAGGKNDGFYSLLSTTVNF